MKNIWFTQPRGIPQVCLALRYSKTVTRYLLTSTLLLLCFFSPPAYAQSDGLPRGANLLPYTRYESEDGVRGGGASLQQSPQFVQTDIASEASHQKYVSLSGNGAFVEWTLTAAAQGVNLRFTMPDNSTGTGLTGSLGLYVNDTKVQNIALSSYWAYQYFPGADPQQIPSSSGKILMRFDEVHFRLNTPLNAGDKLTIKKDNGDNITYGVDFVELEPVPAALPIPANYLSVTAYGAVPDDNNDDFAAFTQCIAAAAAQGKHVYIPAGRFLLSNKLLLNVSNVKIQGAGIWYTYIYFSTNQQFAGGILARASNVEISHLSMNTANNARLVYGGEPNPLGQMYKVYKGFMGTYGANSSVHHVWVEHFECGFWIGGYDPPYPIDRTTNMMISQCRIRNNYADGVNFCQGTSNSTVEQSSVRNNGDDGLAVWPAKDAGNNQNAINNTFRNNTIENNWRAGSIALFGGTGHEVHHNIIRDGVGGSAIRFTNDFSGFTFQYPGDVIKVAENTIDGCGTSYDLWDQKRGAIEIYSQTGVLNMQFDNNTILNSQRDAIQIYGNNLHHMVFNNTLIDGTGLDPVVRDIPRDIYGGFGIYAEANSDSVVFNNLTIRNTESGPYLNRNNSFKLIIRDINIPVTGVILQPATDTTVAQGISFTQKAQVVPVDATNKNLRWSSSNTAVATVDSTGKVTTVGLGTATITVTTQSGNFSATRRITVAPAVNITATDAAAGEGGNTGTFRISAAALTQNVTVSYVISGTASPNDYTAQPPLTGSIQLTPTQPAQVITITPVDDNIFEGPETLRLALRPGTGYQVGNDSAAVITIADNDLPPCTAPVIAQVNGTAPVIDQQIEGAWSIAPIKTITNRLIGGTPAGYGGQWRALYDNNNLYLLVQVNDANKINDSGASWWEDDVIEVFIDGDNSKTATYDGTNDFQLGFRWNDNTIRVGSNSVTRTTGINYRLYATGSGYNLEVAIPWSTIGTTPAAGKPIGLDIQLDNDDDGGTRDAQLATFATTTMAWSDPRVFGTVYLTSCTGTPVNQPPVADAGADRTLAAGTTTVTINGTGTDPEGSAVTYQWTQVSGPTVTIGGANTANANISGLSNGNTYVFQLTVSDGTLTAADQVQVTIGGGTTNVPVTGVTVAPTTVNLSVGGSQQLSATVAPANATNKSVSWQSNNTAVATVNSNGIVNAIAAGTATITVTTTDQGKTATASVTVTGSSSGTKYYRIKNRWQPVYLYDGGTQVNYGNTPNNNNYQWSLEDVGGGYYEIKNRGTGDYMHIEQLQDYVAATTRTPGWQSSRWATESTGDGYVRFRNAWQSANYIHIEGQKGYAQQGTIFPVWQSAHWLLEEVSGASARTNTIQPSGTTEATADLLLYPNPVSRELKLQSKLVLSGGNIRILNSNGNLVLYTMANERNIDVSRLAPGVYTLVYTKGAVQIVKRFVKAE
ncbi:Ig-like domain-containing protein [Chitinophaga pendula]|uniref:sugar-binding protein n=1 Tax=Chitinophaga TaxID=79328 RepID=UPI000BB0720E|nr:MULTISPECIES: sugar-binding protein [Chitinophaga]ASZ09693.1 carbohydrate-binding protein [Chitinophaga sp. MD30]UCJ07367.1 Ig-like domain-containing protein [Chitinophaga pendula]